MTKPMKKSTFNLFYLFTLIFFLTCSFFGTVAIGQSFEVINSTRVQSGVGFVHNPKNHPEVALIATGVNTEVTLLKAKGQQTPYIACPGDATFNCTASTDPFNTGIATATADSCPGTITINHSDVITAGNCASNYTIARTWTAIDNCGNVSSCLQTITVQDNTVPTWATVAGALNASIECSDTAGIAAAQSLAPVASDNCDAALTPVKTAGVFVAGTYTNTWTVSDGCGNIVEAVYTQVITITDNTAPVISGCPSNISLNTDGRTTCDQIVIWVPPTAVDNCTENVIVTSDHNPGDVFPVGTTGVTYTFSDGTNVSTCRFRIKIGDNSAPVISGCPSNISLTTEGRTTCDQIVIWVPPTALDNCTENLIVTSDHNPGDVFPVGTTTVTYTFSDGSNVSTCSFTVTVVDSTPPVVLDCPSNISLATNGRVTCDQAAIWTTPSAVDNCGGIVAVSSNYYPGDLFPVGTTTVIYEFSDGTNVSACSFTVVVVDDSPPVIVCPQNIVACQTDSLILGNATATDNCAIANLYNNAPHAFPIGTTVVTWTATDIHGNSSSCEQTVKIYEPATAIAGNDTSVCQETQYTVSMASARNYSSILWTHNGSGTLINANTLAPAYIQGLNESGKIQLILTAIGNAPCGSVADTMNLDIIPLPHGNAGPDLNVHEQSSVKITGAVASNYSRIFWTHNGTGTMENGNTISPTYFPSTGESGTVSFKMTVIGSESCGESNDVMNIKINPLLLFNAGPDLSTCGTTPVTLSQPTASNYGSLEWKTSGTGTFSDRFILKPIYYPSLTDNKDNHVSLILTASELGSYDDMTKSDTMTLTMKHLPIVEAGPDQVINADLSTVLSGNATGGSTAFAYHWQPANLVLANESRTTGSVPLTVTTKFVLSALDLISGCSDKDSITVYVNESQSHFPPIAIDDYDTTFVNNPILINPLINDSDPNGSPLTYIISKGPSHGSAQMKDNLVFYTPEKNYTGNDEITYVISNEDNTPKSDVATIHIHIGEGLQLIIHNVITPNGDGLNDKWIIEGIEEYPENEVVVFNRWGDKIKSFQRYDNRNEVWDGTDEHNARVSDGTYFFILNIRNAGEYSGWILVRGNS